MKDYHECEKVYIGDSDIAALVFVGMMDENPWIKAQIVSFNIDSCYRAYIINGNEAEVPDHYKKVAEFKYWLKIYDDDELTKEFNAEKIEVYRCGDCGCIIRLWYESEN